MLKGLGNLEDEILISLFGVISSKREDMENKWKNTQKLKKIKTCVLCLIIFNILYNWLVGLKGFTLCIVVFCCSHYSNGNYVKEQGRVRWSEFLLATKTSY